MPALIVCSQAETLGARPHDRRPWTRPQAQRHPAGNGRCIIPVEGSAMANPGWIAGTADSQPIPLVGVGAPWLVSM